METTPVTIATFPNFAFLSYLWGMETKQKGGKENGKQTFYPTYEEWKLFVPVVSDEMVTPFYPTYEEWKLWFAPILSAVIASLFILPMRNGNREQSCRNLKNFLLFILPMRNGNKRIAKLHPNLAKNFLSYLWGMETYRN